MQPSILIAEGDMPTRKMIALALEATDARITECDTHSEALHLATTVKPDIILLDTELSPDEPYATLNALRKQVATPVIALSHRHTEQDVITFLESGADDFIAKPFSIFVLLARVGVQLRKLGTFPAIDETLLFNGELQMHLKTHEVYSRGKTVELTPLEYDLLRFLLLHKGQILSHKKITQAVWGETSISTVHYLRVFVGTLRKKIEANPATPVYIHTQSGVGYKMSLL